jgi:hypothetical protein
MGALPVLLVMIAPRLSCSLEVEARGSAREQKPVFAAFRSLLP